MNTAEGTLHRVIAGEAFRKRGLDAARNVLKTILETEIDGIQGEIYEKQIHQSCVVFEGGASGKICMSFPEPLLKEILEKLFPESSSSAGDHNTIHLVWEVLNMIAGALVVAMETEGLDVNLSPVKSLARFRAEDIDEQCPVFTLKTERWKSQVVILP